MSKRNGKGLFERSIMRLLGIKEPKQAPTTTAVLEPVPIPRSRLNDRDVYAELAPERLDAAWARSASRPRQLAPAQRRAVIGEDSPHAFEERLMRRRVAYEANTPRWMLDELHRADRERLARPVMEMRRFLARCLNDFLASDRSWETRQFLSRHADNMAANGRVRALVAAGDGRAAKELIVAGARRAAGSGEVPTSAAAVEEEPWA